MSVANDVLEHAKESMRFILQNVSEELWKQYHYGSVNVDEKPNAVDCIFSIEDDTNTAVLDFILPYEVDGEDTFYSDYEESKCTEDIIKYLKKNNVEASTSIRKKVKIMGAIESLFDDEEDYGVDNEYDYENEDEIDRDSENIEVDNNIENHYIMECSRCKGIFISALVESDQEVESIRGVCPLCNHESDQIAKWIVRTI